MGNDGGRLRWHRIGAVLQGSVAREHGVGRAGFNRRWSRDSRSLQHMDRGLSPATNLRGIRAGIVRNLADLAPEESGRPQGLGLALIAGLGFAGFYIFMKQAGPGAAPWLAACSRGASLLVTAIITVAGKKFSPFYPKGA